MLAKAEGVNMGQILRDQRERPLRSCGRERSLFFVNAWLSRLFPAWHLSFLHHLPVGPMERGYPNVFISSLSYLSVPLKLLPACLSQF